jgi:lipopolysaccharide export system permease protein
MRIPLTLSRYIARHFLQSILIALLGLAFISTLIDLIELLRRASGREGVPFGVIIRLALLRAPHLSEKLLPYAVLIGSMLALTKLTRTHELIVARAAGISVWQFLAPALLVVMSLGVFMAAAFNPLASALLLRFEKLEGRYLSGKPSLLSISSSGLWLRQLENDASKDVSEHIIYAMRLSQNDMSFANLIIYDFDMKGRFSQRFDADSAVLKPGVLELSKVTHSLPGKPPKKLKSYSLPTSLTLGHIQDSFASPETMSFWQLPSFITLLEGAGFSALRHRVYWNSMLASPLLFAGTVLVAAVFSLRLPRRGKVGLLVVAGVVSGFLLHFFSDIVFALGAAGTLPVELAAWTPTGVVLMIGTALLLHLEDG